MNSTSNLSMYNGKVMGGWTKGKAGRLLQLVVNNPGVYWPYKPDNYQQLKLIKGGHNV